MPPEVAQRALRIGRYVLWLRHGLLVTIVLGLAVQQSLQFSHIGLRLDGWQWNSLIGIGAGALQAGFQGTAWKLFPMPDVRDKRLFAQPPALWLMSNLASVFGEELWIAFCLVTLNQSGHSAVWAVGLIGAAFGSAHYRYGVGAIPKALHGIVSASLFLWRGSLIPLLLFHYIGNMASYYWGRRAFRKIAT